MRVGVVREPPLRKPRLSMPNGSTGSPRTGVECSVRSRIRYGAGSELPTSVLPASGRCDVGAIREPPPTEAAVVHAQMVRQAHHERARGAGHERGSGVPFVLSLSKDASGQGATNGWGRLRAPDLRLACVWAIRCRGGSRTAPHGSRGCTRSNGSTGSPRTGERGGP